MIKRWSPALALGIASLTTGGAIAAEGTAALTPGSGINAALTAADGAGNVSFLHGLCGGAAATMGTACTNQIIVNSSGQVLTLDAQSGSWTVAATQSGTWNITNISGTISLPTGASTSALQTTGNTALTTINTTLGTPAQQTGAVVGITGTVAVTQSGTWSNTVTQATAGNLHAQVSSVAGAFVSGSFVSGALADGSIVTMGTEADTAWSGSGSGTEIAILKKIAATAGAANASVGTNGSATPTSSTAVGYSDGTNLQQVSPTNPLPVTGGAIQAANSVPISISTATTTLLVAASGSTAIYVTSWDVIANGTGNFTLEYGTGSSCTGTHALTGAYPLTAQTGISKGSGIGPVLFVPASNALCAVTSAAVQMSGSVSYNQQ